MNKNNKKNMEVLNPQIDFIFKKIFGEDGNENITKDFVSSIIGEKIKKLEIKNPNLLRESINDKGEELDIKAVLDNNVLCDIEIQVANNHDDDKRILNYWSKMYRKSIHKSFKYKQMKKTIVIFITSYDVDNLKDLKEYKTKWKIIESKYRKTVLTDIFEVDIIELSKAKRLINENAFEEEENLKNWIKFLINPMELGGKDMGGKKVSVYNDLSEEIKQAYIAWQNINLTEEERDVAERKYMDLLSLDYGREYERKLGRKIGRKEGRKEGREEGRKESQIRIAKKMLDEGFEISTIVNITELTEKEVTNIQ